MNHEVCAAGLAHAIPRPFVRRVMETHGLGEETEHVGFVTGKAVAEEMLDEWKHQVVPLIIVGMLVKTNGSTICRQFFAPIHFDTFFAGAEAEF